MPGEQVCLVHEYNVDFSLGDLLDVRVQVGAVEEQRVPRVDNLHDDVADVDDVPELPPEVEVLLEGRQAAPLPLLYPAGCNSKQN